MMKYINSVLLLCMLSIISGCDNSKAVIGYIDIPDNMDSNNEKLEGVFYTALNEFPIEKIEIYRGKKSFPIYVTAKEGYKMDEQMKQRILDQLEDYKKSLVFITDEQGTLVSAQQAKEIVEEAKKHDVETNEGDKPYYLLSSWRNAHMKVYTTRAPSFYDRLTPVFCVLTFYPKWIEDYEINEYPSLEKNHHVFESLGNKPFIVGYDEKYDQVLKRDLGQLAGYKATSNLDINGSFHSACWNKLKNDVGALYDPIYQAKVLGNFKSEK